MGSIESDLWSAGRADAPGLLARLGGVAEIARIVTQLHERLAADPELAPCLHVIGRPVTHRQFSLVAAHLVDVLEELQVDPDTADGVVSWFAQGRVAVVDDPSL